MEVIVASKNLAVNISFLRDGVLRAEQEIELGWGEAEIALRPYGRILLRDTYITSQASATERILGGSVHVN